MYGSILEMVTNMCVYKLIDTEKKECSTDCFALKNHPVEVGRSGPMNVQLLIFNMAEARWVYDNGIECGVGVARSGISENEFYVASEFAFEICMKQWDAT